MLPMLKLTHYRQEAWFDKPPSDPILYKEYLAS